MRQIYGAKESDDDTWPKTKIDELLREYPFLEDFLLGSQPNSGS